LQSPRAGAATLFPYTTLFRSVRGAPIPAPAVPLTGRERVAYMARTAGDKPPKSPDVIDSWPPSITPWSPGWPPKTTKDGKLVVRDRKSTRLNSSHLGISYAVF